MLEAHGTALLQGGRRHFPDVVPLGDVSPAGCTVIVMDTSLLAIETLLIARYGEVQPDGTLTVIGAGISTVVRPPEAPAQLTVVGTLLTEGPIGKNAHRLYCKLRDPSGVTQMELSLDVTVEGGARRRLPLCLPLPLPAGMEPGEWQVELSGEGDLRVLALEVQHPAH